MRRNAKSARSYGFDKEAQPCSANSRIGLIFCAHQAVELRDGALVARLADVPHFDAALSARVDVLGRVADGDGANDLTMRQCVYLARVARNTWPHKCVRRERHRLHLPVGAHMKRVRRFPPRYPAQSRTQGCPHLGVWVKANLEMKK